MTTAGGGHQTPAWKVSAPCNLHHHRQGGWRLGWGGRKQVKVWLSSAATKAFLEGRKGLHPDVECCGVELTADHPVTISINYLYCKASEKGRNRPVRTLLWYIRMGNGYMLLCMKSVKSIKSLRYIPWFQHVFSRQPSRFFLIWKIPDSRYIIVIFLMLVLWLC